MADIQAIIQTTPEGPTFLLRHDAYRPGEAQELIADVLSLANAASAGKRYVVFGVEAQPGSAERRVHGVAEAPNTQMWQHLVHEYIEPEITIEYRTETLADLKVGVLILPPCTQAPYLLKRTFGGLQHGSSFIRRDTGRERLMRADLESIYARRYDIATRFAGLLVGFTGDPPLHALELRRQLDAALPSHADTSKLREMIEARRHVDQLADGAESGIVRMVHMRVYGADVPYESKTLAQLNAELEQVERSFREEDRHARYERDAARVNFTVVNDSLEALEEAALIVHFPVAKGFDIAYGADATATSARAEGKRERAAVSVARILGRIERGARVAAFAQPLRVVLTSQCRHSLLPVRYELRASNLPYPMPGKLELKVA